MKTPKDHSQDQRRTRRLILSLSVGLGLIVTTAIFWELQSLAHKRSVERFSHLAERHAGACARTLQDRTVWLNSLQSLCANMPKVGRDEFQEFTESSLLQFESTVAVQWVPLVAAKTRHKYEQQARREGLEHFQFIQRGRSGVLKPACERPEYYPVLCTSPHAPNIRTLGYDLGSDDDWKSVLDQSAQEGEMTVTTKVCLPYHDPNAPTVTMVQPVYAPHTLRFSPEGRRANLKGFVIGVFNLKLLLESALKSLDRDGIHVELLDATNNGEVRRSSPLVCPVPTATTSHHTKAGRNRLVHETLLWFHNQRWCIRCSAGPSFYAVHQSWGPVIVLAAGLVITVLTGVLLRTHLVRHEKVCRLVAERTRELAQSQAELKNKNGFLHHMLNSLAHPLYVIDADDFTIKLSNRLPPTGNGTERPTCYQIIHDLESPCDVTDRPCPIQRVKETRKPVSFERQDSDREGQARTLEVHAYPVLDGDGNVTEIIEYHVDITDRKRTEQKLREQLRFTETLLDTIPKPVFYKNIDGRYLGCNRAFEELVGHCTDEIVGKTVFDMSPATVAYKYEERDQELFTWLGKQHYEWKVQTGEGQMRDVMFDKATFTDAEGNVAGLIGVISDITERKQTEGALRESKQRLDLALHGADLGTWDWNVVTGETRFDARWTQMLGYRQHEIRPHVDSWKRLVHPDDLPATMETLGAHLRGKTNFYNAEYRMKHKCGDWIWILDKGKVIERDKDGNPSRACGTHQNITQRKLMEKQLDSLAKFPSENPNPVFRANRDGTTTYANEAGIRVLKAFGLAVGDSLPPRWAAPATKALETNTERKEELEYGDRILSVTFAPVADSGYVNLYAHDVTGRRLAEQNVEKNRLFLQTILDSISGNVAVLDSDGQINRVNRSWLEFGRDNGLAPDYVFEGVDYLKLCREATGPSSEGAAEMAEGIFSVLTQAQPFFQAEYPYHSADQCRWFQLRTSSFQFHGTSWVVLTHIDVTEQKNAEKRQAVLLEDLESINAELRDFAHIVSHDLKAPLRGIRTVADWLVTDYGERLGENGKEQLCLLTNRVTRMQNLIDGILEYSRIARNREDRVVVDLRKLVSDTIDSLMPPEGMTLTVDDNLPAVYAEPTRMNQLFQNLLSNAIKHMDKEDGIIRIGCADAGAQWQLFVADNGPGIEARHFERIFRLFQTLSSRDQHESTGVGLTVAKKIVELHGGTIWLESHIDEGTTFYFTLPKAKMEATDARPETSVAC